MASNSAGPGRNVDGDGNDALEGVPEGEGRFWCSANRSGRGWPSEAAARGRGGGGPPRPCSLEPSTGAGGSGGGEYGY